jgi:murein DD-endopeptidase MepM/ murein hydrolase activator NlpD
MKIRHIIPITISVIAVLLFTACPNKSGDIHEQGEINTQEPVKDTIILYGIDATNYDVVDDVVKDGETLSNILTNFNVSQGTINSIAENSKNTFDVRKLRAGADYSIFLSNDTIPVAHYMVYQIDKIKYVVYSFKDSVYSQLVQRPTDTVLKVSSGVITTSLWNAVIDCGISPKLTDELSKIYAWTVDFFGIQKDDSFKMLYEEILVDDTVVVDCGRILAAELTNVGKTYKSYYFDYKDNKGYFDEKGASMKKQFLKAPLEYTRISSRFSNARMHPIYKVVRPHHGVDYAAPAGTPVHTIGNGTVIAKGYDKKGGGNYVKIKHNDTYTTVYMHLKGFAKDIAVGTRVKQGQLIGFVGSTGAATGPHLDFRVYKKGVAIDPLSMIPEPADPISKKDMLEFEKIVKQYSSILDDVPITHARTIDRINISDMLSSDKYYENETKIFNPTSFIPDFCRMQK